MKICLRRSKADSRMNPRAFGHKNPKAANGNFALIRDANDP